MRDRWLDDHVGDETVVRPDFEELLGGTLQTAWRRPEGSPIRPPSRPSRRTKVLIWAAAAAVLLVGGAVVLARTGKSSVTSNTGDVTLPVTAPPTVIVTTAVPPETTAAATTSLPPPTTVAPEVVATSPEQQTVLDYLTALSEKRYVDAAKLLGEGGLSLEDRSDLRPFLGPDGKIPDLAGSLQKWCAEALCLVPTLLAGTDSTVTATFTVDGVSRTALLDAGTFEGSPQVRGLPIQLPTGVALADTVQCLISPSADTALADLNGDGWFETVVADPTDNAIVSVCGTDLRVPTFTWEVSGSNDPPTRILPLDIEGDGSDEFLAATTFPDGFHGTVVGLRSGRLQVIWRPLLLFPSMDGNSFGCTDLDGDGTRDLVSYKYSLVGGTELANSTRLDYTATLVNEDGTDGISTTGSLPLPAQLEEAVRLISGYCGNFATQTG